MFPLNMMVIVFCTSPDSTMYPGNLTGTMVERGRLSARSAGSSLPPIPAGNTRTRTAGGAEGGYLGGNLAGSEWWLFQLMRSQGTPALEAAIGMGAAEKIGGDKAHGPNIG